MVLSSNIGIVGLCGVVHCAAAVSSEYFDLAARMIESNVQRGQGLSLGGQSTGLIELGIFQQALRVAIPLSSNQTQRQQWKDYLQISVTGASDILSNTTEDTQLPLDRFSVGSSMIILNNTNTTNSPSFDKPITALKNSAQSQPRNSNGGLWYYDNVSNLTAYQNLSYLDGMYSYPLFASLSNTSEDGYKDALCQFQLLHDICVTPSGLLVHGYDAIKNHSWSNPVTGASSVVWSRSQAWYTLGLLNTIHYAMDEESLASKAILAKLKELFNQVTIPQITASEHSLSMTGLHGVWQVVDRPGGEGNFIEASSSFMTVYSLLSGYHLNLFDSQNTTQRAMNVAINMYSKVSQAYLIRNGDATLSLNGTSSVASLSGQVVDYEYYISRPTELNSLIGTSAFILASLAMD